MTIGGKATIRMRIETDLIRIYIYRPFLPFDENSSRYSSLWGRETKTDKVKIGRVVFIRNATYM